MPRLTGCVALDCPYATVPAADLPLAPRRPAPSAACAPLDARARETPRRDARVQSLVDATQRAENRTSREVIGYLRDD